jgi:AraC-like DNA-binding protein
VSTGLIASGNLATSRRTIMGVLGQCALFALGDQRMLEIFMHAGLPERALEDLEFPISLDQELEICNEIARTLATQGSVTCAVFNAMQSLGIEVLGVLGMAMRHASTAVEALKVCLTYPQLAGGHSRLVVTRQGGEIQFAFAMERPQLHNASAQDIDNLVHYCLTLDLVTSVRNIDTMLHGRLSPRYMTLPFEQPEDWHAMRVKLPCPILFSQTSASVVYATQLDTTFLPDANPLLFRSYVSLAEKMSLMLAGEFSLAERVTRWLWAYSPPPKRSEIASLLAMSERSLTRRLGQENTSYSKLLASVQEERAKNLLRTSALSIAQISDRLGYAEPAVFSRAFSHWTGVPPGKWRRSLHHQIEAADLPMPV